MNRESYAVRRSVKSDSNINCDRDRYSINDNVCGRNNDTEIKMNMKAIFEIESNSENKAGKNLIIRTHDLCYTTAMLYQLSKQANWELVITVCWFVISLWSDESKPVNVWKSYIWTSDKEMNMKVIFTIMNTT